MLRSIRSRLALSFAAIALVAAVILGVVLLAILQNYYLNQELDYLRGNAQTISGLVTNMMSANATHDEMQSQIQNLAFLTQTRIRVYSPDGKQLYDSGSPQNIKVNLGVLKQNMALNDAISNKVVISVGESQSGELPPLGATSPSTTPMPGSNSIFIYRSIQVGGSPFGFALKLNSQAAPVAARSNLQIRELMRDPQNNNELGSIQLSEGPAYGSAILANVAWGWTLASAVAILLAALIGWFISRRISAPVLALIDVTTHMSQGNLSSRADIKSRDEFGQLARSFNEMADQVETTVTTLRRFVSDAAHELRTPLTALRTNLDLALDEQNAAERATFLSRAETMVKRLEELSSNLLDLSRLEANGLSAAIVTVDLKELLQARGELYASQADQAGLTFELDLHPQPIFIRSDRGQIARAMDNLIDNACKFTPRGGTIRAALSQQDDQAVFSVMDSGIGIPADDLSQIFNRFHRGRNTTAYAGSGLGLAIVKAIVTAHQGQVEVQSAGEGEGSQFSIRLPIVTS